MWDAPDMSKWKCQLDSWTCELWVQQRSLKNESTEEAGVAREKISFNSCGVHKYWGEEKGNSDWQEAVKEAGGGGREGEQCFGSQAKEIF